GRPFGARSRRAGYDFDGGIVDLQSARSGSWRAGGCRPRPSRVVARPHSRSACPVCVVRTGPAAWWGQPLQAQALQAKARQTMCRGVFEGVRGDPRRRQRLVVPVARDRGMLSMVDQGQREQLLHLVFGGELTDLDRVEFRHLDKRDIVGIYPNYAAAYAAWKAKAQQTVDNAHMRYFIVHLHRLLDPQMDQRATR